MSGLEGSDRTRVRPCRLSPFRPLALAALAAAVSPAAAEPLRFRWDPGDVASFAAEFRMSTVVRRGARVERFAFVRPGRQVVTVCSVEAGQALLAAEIEHGTARPTLYSVDGRDQLRAEGERLAKTLPGPESVLEFLTLDDRGRGTPAPLDPGLADAVLRALSEVEELPEGEEEEWRREGAVGKLAWKAVFRRSGTTVTATFEFSQPPEGGARATFGPAKALLEVRAGRMERVEGAAEWTVAAAEGSETREVEFALRRTSTERAHANVLAEVVATASGPAAAAEAWRVGERDRALELWEKSAGAGGRWAAASKSRAEAVRRDWPALGATVGPLGGGTWIGQAPAEGRWRLVYFWAGWIPRCGGELEALAKLASGRERVAFAGVTKLDVMQTEELARAAAAKAGGPAVLLDSSGESFKAFKVEDLPRVFLVDPEGRVRFAGKGNEVETLKGLLERLVPE